MVSRDAAGGPPLPILFITLSGDKMTIATAELIDIDFLWFLADEAIDEPICDGDLVTFDHPRRGRVTGLQSGRFAMLVGGYQDSRGLPATADITILPDASPSPSTGHPEASGVVIPFPAR